MKLAAQTCEKFNNGKKLRNNCEKFNNLIAPKTLAI
nr:MAG TPA: hypothetical protein [Caudoviricetes sp.]